MLVFETTDADVAHDTLLQTYGHMRLTWQGEGLGLSIRQAALGTVALHRVSFNLSLEADVAPLGAFYFGHLESGQLGFSRERQEERHAPGDAFLMASPDQPYGALVDHAEVPCAVLPAHLFAQVAETAPARTPAPLRFDSYRATSPEAGRRWVTAYDFACDLAETSGEDSPLLAGTAARLLAAVALTTFPNNAVTDAGIEDRHDAHPDTLRRAMTFIDENAHTDIAIADIAAAAFVTSRAVQLAFRRHLDTTPMAYLRRVRLGHAHDELLAADPHRTTIIAVARRWGFSSHSAFSAHYHQAYGRSPSTTLRA